MSIAVITENTTEGTLILGTFNAEDEARLRRLGWRWNETLETWSLPRRESGLPDLAGIQATVNDLLRHGFDAMACVGDEHPTHAKLVATFRLLREAEAGGGLGAAPMPRAS